MLFRDSLRNSAMPIFHYDLLTNAIISLFRLTFPNFPKSRVAGFGRELLLLTVSWVAPTPLTVFRSREESGLIGTIQTAVMIGPASRLIFSHVALQIVL